MRGGAYGALLAGLVTIGCGASAERGPALYGQGRYIEAAEVFERTEPRLARSSAEDCARYGLYRGLTFLRLDDLRGAREWLSYASSVERKHPGQLSSDERRSLERAWAELARRSKDQGESPSAPAGAVAATDPEAVPHVAGPTANGRRSVRTE